MALTSKEDLRTVYRSASQVAIDKVITRLDHHVEDFLAKSPFFVLSTADADGRCDGSPKGGEPGFVRILDERRVGWADYSGNNRLDSFENMVTNPSVALLFMIPGLNETLRINGVAELSTDSELCEQLATKGRPAKVAVVVTVDEAYLHCAKALRRGSLWDTDAWPEPEELPSGPAIFKDHGEIDVDTDLIQAALDADLEATLWEPGGNV